MLSIVINEFGLEVDGILDSTYYPPFDAVLQARVRTALATWEINRLPSGTNVLTCLDSILGMVYCGLPDGYYDSTSLEKIIRLNGHVPEIESAIAEFARAERCGVPCAHAPDVHDCLRCRGSVAFECSPSCTICLAADRMVCTCPRK